MLSFAGRLWIHAASKVPDEATIKAMEEFYREIYAVNGITNPRFPEHYPVSRLIGISLNVVDTHCTYEDRSKLCFFFYHSVQILDTAVITTLYYLYTTSEVAF